ncbi:MAG: hypothetical protein ACRDYX_04180 [Egibacteraceae bacterium]
MAGLYPLLEATAGRLEAILEKATGSASRPERTGGERSTGGWWSGCARPLIRWAAPATPDLQALRWEGWHELLWQIQWPLDGAAEQIHADEAGRELAQASWKHVRGFAQGWPDEHRYDA